MSLAAFQPRRPEFGRIAREIGAAAFRRARRHRLEVSLSAGLLAMLAGAYLGFAIAPTVERAPAPPSIQPAWVEVARPLPMFSFAAPELAHLQGAYAMRRHSTGGGREDALTYGAFASPDPWLRIVVHQVGGEGAVAQTLFVETARRAAEAGLALDGLGKSGTLPTRFGEAEWAEARLAAPGQADARNGCAVFRFSAAQPDLAVFGVACGPNGTGFTRRQLSCLVGGLDLSAASEDEALQKFFARSELARDLACSGPRPRAAAAPARKPLVKSAMQR